LVPATMKNAANCDTSCELQNSVNHQIFERTLRSGVYSKSTYSSVSPSLKLGSVLSFFKKKKRLRFDRKLSFAMKIA